MEEKKADREIETNHPRYLGIQDICSACLKRVVDIYQQSFIDINSDVGFVILNGFENALFIIEYLMIR